MGTNFKIKIRAKEFSLKENDRKETNYAKSLENIYVSTILMKI